MIAMTKIGPIGRDQDGVGIRRRKKEMHTTISLPPAKDSDQLSFKRMTLADDGNLSRKTLMVGSLSSDRSIR